MNAEWLSKICKDIKEAVVHFNYAIKQAVFKDVALSEKDVRAFCVAALILLQEKVLVSFCYLWDMKICGGSNIFFFSKH